MSGWSSTSVLDSRKHDFERLSSHCSNCSQIWMENTTITRLGTAFCGTVSARKWHGQIHGLWRWMDKRWRLCICYKSLWTISQQQQQQHKINSVSRGEWTKCARQSYQTSKKYSTQLPLSLFLPPYRCNIPPQSNLRYIIPTERHDDDDPAPHCYWC